MKLVTWVSHGQCLGSFWAWLVKILVILNLASYMLTSSGLTSIYLKYILKIPLK